MNFLQKLTILICLTSFGFITNAEDNNPEPCSSVEIPKDLHLRKLLFELPTYEEYITDLEHEAMNKGLFLEDVKVMTKQEYDKVRSLKESDILSIFQNNCKIVSKEDYKKNIIQYSYEYGYVLQESLAIDMIETKENGLLEVTSFHITDIKSLNRFTLIDPRDGHQELKCLFQKDNFEYKELLALL